MKRTNNLLAILLVSAALTLPGVAKAGTDNGNGNNGQNNGHQNGHDGGSDTYAPINTGIVYLMAAGAAGAFILLRKKPAAVKA